MNTRPIGITIIAAVYIFLGVLSLLWSGLVFGMGSVTALATSLFGSGIGTNAAWAGLLGLVTAGVQLAVGLGLWSMKKWAWYLALISVALMLIQGLIGVFNGGGAFSIICGGLGLVVPIIIVVYLLSSNIRSKFGV